MMRIISGIRRGKKLTSLPGENTRPTLERVKQAFFNAIQFEIKGQTVLDLFAGSGQLGLEALSRGADFCCFNDSSKDACAVIEKNIRACSFTEISQLTCNLYSDCVTMLKQRNKKISLVFLDPPYGENLVNDALDLLVRTDVLSDGAVVVCESGAHDAIDATGFKVRREYVYSAVKITILEKE